MIAAAPVARHRLYFNMKQFILNDAPDRNGRVRLTGGDYRYLAKVRRLAPGEYFPALLPGGDTVLLRVLSVDNKTLVGEQTADSTCLRVKEPGIKLPPIILFQALPKGDKMDLIVRQAAESGLAEIVPFVSEFSTAGNGGGHKFSRWERIIREARQQSGSAVQTTIRQPVSIDGAFAYWEQVKVRQPGTLGLLFHHLPLENESLHGYLTNRPEMVLLVIGPEGGFSPAEAERFTSAGFRPFTFTGAILRTETAALYATAAVQVLLTERDSWKTK